MSNICNRLTSGLSECKLDKLDVFLVLISASKLSSAGQNFLATLLNEDRVGVVDQDIYYVNK